jgi:hypothetical protein
VGVLIFNVGCLVFTCLVLIFNVGCLAEVILSTVLPDRFEGLQPKPRREGASEEIYLPDM